MSQQTQIESPTTNFSISPTIRQRFNAYPEALKVIVEILSKDPTLVVECEVTGAGDSGDYIDCETVNKEGNRTEVTEQQRNKIEDWLWETASEEVQGYEINDGGGFHASFSIEGTKLKYARKGWYNEVIESIQVQEVL